MTAEQTQLRETGRETGGLDPTPCTAIEGLEGLIDSLHLIPSQNSLSFLFLKNTLHTAFCMEQSFKKDNAIAAVKLLRLSDFFLCPFLDFYLSSIKSLPTPGPTAIKSGKA